MALSNEILGLVLVGALFVAIVLGFPIAFTLIILAVIFGLVGFGDLVIDLMYFQMLQTLKSAELAAVPLFLLMGYLLERANLMNRLFHAFQMMLASVRGSLYVATLGVSTLFAAATGIVGASVSIMGLMAAPAMRKSGYDTRLSAGSIAAGGTLGILIPPSVMLIVMAIVFQVSVVRLFAAAILPGLLLSTLFIGYCLIRCRLNPELGAPVPEDERPQSLGPVVREFAVGLVPPAVLILATLGSILGGLATPTEAASMGAFGAFLLLIGYRQFNWGIITDAIYRTGQTSCMILFLVAASNFFGAVFSRLGTPQFIAESLLTFNFSPTLFLIFLLVVIFILGWPLEWVPIVVIVLPIFLPLIEELNFDLIWFCTLVAVTLQTAWLSPPVALSAYFLKGVVPEWDLKDIYIGMVQFMGLQLIGAAMLIAFPAIALWLPNLIYG